MSQKQTQFIVLSNEVSYCIYKYLISTDIFQAFSQFSHRYYHQWLQRRQKTASIDMWNKSNIKGRPISYSFINQLLIFLSSFAVSSECIQMELSGISSMNLNNLTLAWNKKMDYDCDQIRILQTVARFFMNEMLNVDFFCMNPNDLNVWIDNVVHLVDIQYIEIFIAVLIYSSFQSYYKLLPFEISHQMQYRINFFMLHFHQDKTTSENVICINQRSISIETCTDELLLLQENQ